LLVAIGLKIYEIEIESMQINRVVDMQNIIEDYEIKSMSALGDTLYVYTTNSKIYKFNSIDAIYSGIVVLEEADSNTRICAIDSDVVYSTKEYDILVHSLIDGAYIDKLPFNRGVKIDINLLYDGFFTLDLEKTRELIKYRTDYIIKEI
jgi:hypothetical protein